MWSSGPFLRSRSRTAARKDRTLLRIGDASLFVPFSDLEALPDLWILSSLARPCFPFPPVILSLFPSLLSPGSYDENNCSGVLRSVTKLGLRGESFHSLFFLFFLSCASEH